MNIFSSWMLYLILGLAASTAYLGWLSLSLHDDKVIAEQALVQAIDANTALQKSLNLKDLSCKIDDKSVVEVEADKKHIDEVTSPINAQLKDLAIVNKAATKSPMTAPKQNETTKDESNFLPDDGLLSPNVTRLLNDGWCAVYPSTSECVPAGQLAGKSM